MLPRELPGERAGRHAAEAAKEPEPNELARAMQGLTYERVLVIVGWDGRFEIIPLTPPHATGFP